MTWSTTQFDSISNILLEENPPLVYFLLLFGGHAAAFTGLHCQFVGSMHFFPLKFLSIFYFSIHAQNIEIFIIIVLRKILGCTDPRGFYFAVRAAVAVQLLAGHPEETAQDPTLNGSI